MSTVIAQERLRHELFPPSVRALIQARIPTLTPLSRQLIMASAVLGTQSCAQDLSPVAHIDVQDGTEALEAALKSALLHAEIANIGPASAYRSAHYLSARSVCRRT